MKMSEMKSLNTKDIFLCNGKGHPGMQYVNSFLFDKLLEYLSSMALDKLFLFFKLEHGRNASELSASAGVPTQILYEIEDSEAVTRILNKFERADKKNTGISNIV